MVERLVGRREAEDGQMFDGVNAPLPGREAFGQRRESAFGAPATICWIHLVGPFLLLNSPDRISMNSTS